MNYAIFKYLMNLLLLQAHMTMHKGKPCLIYHKEEFPEGITNGADWYSVTGGMQDWNYNFAGVRELTLELGCTKYPFEEDLPKYWKDNREALIKYIELIHIGVTGRVQSNIGHPISNAAITINNLKHITYTTKNGEFWRLLLPGNYSITIEAVGYLEVHDQIIIPESGSLLKDYNVMPDDPQHWSSAHDYRTIDNVVRTM